MTNFNTWQCQIDFVLICSCKVLFTVKDNSYIGKEMHILSDSLKLHYTSYNKSVMILPRVEIIYVTEFYKVFFNTTHHHSAWPSGLRPQPALQMITGSSPAGNMYFHFEFFARSL